MANRIKIQLLSQPANFSTLNYTVNAASPYYADSGYFVFTAGTPTNGNMVQIGTTLQQTINNLHAVLVQFATNTVINFTLEGEVIYMNFNQELPLVIYSHPESWLFFEINNAIIPVPETIDPLILFSFQIEIIDTYENERILIEELTSIGSPKLTYDSGDDIFEPFMNSTLEFNILDLEAQDAKFYHLFTGDENRYLVKLSNVGYQENTQLIWQGFLLPDQYSEPYKNGVVPVNFTAVDMISTLKGKYLDPWIYYQKFTLPEFFSIAMSFTGLDQDFIVKPSIVSASPQVKWQNIIVNLEPYIESGKYTDIYKIVEDILISQCLTMKSYRGYWWLEGITRKGELSGPAVKIRYDNAASENLEITKSVVAPMNSAGSVNFRAITPFKSVAVGFDFDQQGSLLPEDVVVRNSYFLGYDQDHYVDTTPVNTFFKQWLKIGCSTLGFLKPKSDFSFGLNSYYYANEAAALVNYFECVHKPYLSPQRTYEIEIEVELTLYFYLAYYANVVSDNLLEGRYDNFVLFQMLLDGNEIRSNRPSAPTYSQNIFEKSYKSNDAAAKSHTTTFRLKREFELGSDGYITLRFLHPMYGNVVIAPSGVGGFTFAVKTLKITVPDAKDDENIRAIRAINFTQEKSIDLPITCSVNGAIQNSFSIGSRIGNQEMIIPVLNQENENFHQVFPPLNDLLMVTKKFKISQALAGVLFDENKTKSLYLQKASGEKKHFFSVYVKKQIIGNYRLHYLINWSGRPFKPKDYIRMPVVENTDVLKLKLSDFTNEDYSQREFWHVHGFPEWVENYPKTVANVYHSVRKEPSFGLETTVLFLMLPDNLLNFYFAGQNRNFIPTRLELDLSSGKTTVNLKEATLNQINDISYE